MRIKLFVILTFLFCCKGSWAVSEQKLMQLEAEMLKYISTSERDQFLKITEELKEASKEAGKERLFYKAWSNQAVYEASFQNYSKALDIVQQIMDYAKGDGSVYGEYSSLHAKAMVLLKKQSYDSAEKAFQEAVEYWHKHFPNESAGDDLQELMNIANHRKDAKAGVAYAQQILAEPNVAPLHKGRALFRLSQIAFNKNDAEEFNRIYEEMMKLKESDSISTVRPLIEVNHCIINGEFEEALRLAEQLNDEEEAERKAVIYHRMGDEENAFKYLMQYKKINDSITLVSHDNVMSGFYVQMNNERLQLEKLMLEAQNDRLRDRLYLTIGIVCLILLLFVIFKRGKTIKSLKNSNKSLLYKQKDIERTLDDIAELSKFESQTSIPLTTSVDINTVCNRMATKVQSHCHRGVSVIFATQLPNGFEIKTNLDALEKILKQLLDNAVRFTHKGRITLGCKEEGENIRFTVTDTGAALGSNLKSGVLTMFNEPANKIHAVSMSFNICLSITRLLQGHIWIDKDYTDGTRFCVEIPKEPNLKSKS